MYLISLILISSSLAFSQSKNMFESLNQLDNQELLSDDISFNTNPLNEDELEELDILRKKEEEAVHQIINSKFKKLDENKKFAYKVQLEDILKSSTYLGYIKKGSFVINMTTDQYEVVTKNIYVRVFSLEDRYGYKVLQSKNGKINYKVNATDITNINLITDLHPSPKEFTPESSSKKNIKFNEKKLDVETLFYSGRTRTNMLEKAAKTKEQARVSRYELRSKSNFELPFKLGLSFQFNNIQNATDSSSHYKLNTIALGPMIEFESIFSNPYGINLNLSFHSSLWGQFENKNINGSSKFNVSQSNLAISLEKVFTIPMGHFITGLNYVRSWSQINSQDFDSNLSATDSYDDNFSIILGYGLAWDI